MQLTTETDRERLERALDREPGNQELRLLLADLREEAGEDTRAARWRAARGKWPYRAQWLTAAPEEWSWWAPAADRRHVELPRPVREHLRLCGFAIHPTRAAAEADADRAFAAAFADGWDPDAWHG